MKTKTFLFVLLGCIVLLAVSSSCTSINDYRLNAFEKSINELNDSYLEKSPNQVKKAIQNCEKKKSKLSDNIGALSINQTTRYYKLSGTYALVLAKVEGTCKIKSLTDKGYRELQEFVEKTM